MAIQAAAALVTYGKSVDFAGCATAGRVIDQWCRFARVRASTASGPPSASCTKMRPTTGASLKPCPEKPAPTTMLGRVGIRSIMKSSSLVIV